MKSRHSTEGAPIHSVNYSLAVIFTLRRFDFYTSKHSNEN